MEKKQYQTPTLVSLTTHTEAIMDDADFMGQSNNVSISDLLKGVGDAGNTGSL